MRKIDDGVDDDIDDDAFDLIYRLLFLFKDDGVSISKGHQAVWLRTHSLDRSLTRSLAHSLARALVPNV